MPHLGFSFWFYHEINWIKELDGETVLNAENSCQIKRKKNTFTQNIIEAFIKRSMILAYWVLALLPLLVVRAVFFRINR